jgi:uncharacterized membrane protein
MTTVTEIRDQSKTVEFYEHGALTQRMRVSAGTVRGLIDLYQPTLAYITWRGDLTKIYLAEKREAA